MATGAKSFVDNPLLGSGRLNRAGLHLGRVRLAHALGRWRRGRLTHAVPPDWREQFDRDGYIAVPGILPLEEFVRLRAALLQLDLECREHQQGETVTLRLPVGPQLLREVPVLAKLLADPSWRAAMAYVAATRSEPLYYLQAVAGGVAEGAPDPQVELHADTFHPSMKAWLFLTNVADEERPLTYVAGSHRLSPQRAAWEQAKSVDVMASDDRLSQRGSLRISPEELEGLGLPQPTRFTVPANTLVIADTCGFHARGDSDQATLRIELWAYCRRTPFLPWTGLDPLSALGLSKRKAELATRAVDWLAARGWMKQHWRPAGPWRERLASYQSSVTAGRSAGARTETARSVPVGVGF